MENHKRLFQLIRWVYRHLHPHARNSLDLALQLLIHDRPPALISGYKHSKVLVLAPHMDDEVIGCGGAIALHAAEGSRVTVAFMTDGRMGDARLLNPDLAINEREQIQENLVRTRKKEAQACAEKLGVRNLVFFDAEDGRLRPAGILVEKLADLLARESPEIIYLPFIMDSHEDHWQTNRVFFESLDVLPSEFAKKPVFCRGYEVWSPLVANRLADITGVASLKAEALGEYQSQLKDVDYRACVQGMNKFRAIGLKGGEGFAEAFFECSVNEYKALHKHTIKSKPVCYTPANPDDS